VDPRAPAAGSMKAYQAIPELLGRVGLDTVFGVLGSSNVAWIGHGVDRGGLRLVHVRHEQTAVTAAAAFARVSGRVGLASVTLGPGFANTVNSLAAAIHDHIPLILFVGQSPSGKMHGDFQRLNQREIVAALGAGFHAAGRVTELEGAVRDAWTEVQRNGTPQVVSVDEAFLDEEVQLSPQWPVVQHEDEFLDPQAVSAAVDALSSARCPLILAGQGAALADCRADLIELADLTGARLASTLNVHRFFAGDRRDLGVCGTSASPIVVNELAAVDVVFAVGATLNTFTLGEGSLFGPAKIIQCEVDPEARVKASPPSLALLGDAKRVTRAVIEEWNSRGLARRPEPEDAPDWGQMQKSVLATDIGADALRGLDPRDVYVVMGDKLPRDRVIVIDGGRASYPAPALLDAIDGRSWLNSRGYGSVGLGIGAAIGAGVAAPGRRVALFCGDGGFMMAANELDTIRREGLDVTIVVLNDEQYGSEVKYCRRYGLTSDVTHYSMPDLPKLAEAYGGSGVTVSTREELVALQPSSPGLEIFDMRIDPDADATNL
jgi:thiamine pyrophosphate-dependent acetolactate synthase large subunit-like protein